MQPTAKYINPFTDFGFKRLFGEEPNKDLLKDFLNELLREERGEIQDIIYLNNEKLGNTELDRKAIFDEDKDKNKNKNTNPNKYRYDVKLTEQETKTIFYGKLTFTYLVMPKFNKTLNQLKTHFDKWLYIFKNLNQMQEIPKELQEAIFSKLFNTSEIANFKPEELQKYENSLKYYRDLKNSLDTAREEGKEEGIAEGLAKGLQLGKQKEQKRLIKHMQQLGFEIDQIASIIGLSLAPKK